LKTRLKLNEESKRDSTPDLQLASAFDKNINMVNQQATVKCIGTFVGHKGSVSSVLSYNDYFISASLDGTSIF
jgi:WD40 repeat protein